MVPPLVCVPTAEGTHTPSDAGSNLTANRQLSEGQTSAKILAFDTAQQLELPEFGSKRIVKENPSSRRAIRTFLFLSVAVLGNSFGNLLLALGMDRMPDFASLPFLSYLGGLVGNPYLLPGAALTATYTVAQISLFSWADLSYVIPCIASSYILSTVLGELVLNEHVTAMRWAGVLLIFLGVALVANTPVATREQRTEAQS